ncbi:helix-turn-helix domain-containing protein [Flavobacterium sp. J372]|uniref:helix-turn-helix domain-containing protein n=1 Tax=Flavobacterium sp. J372 TaxID=2898436 RepID=UPI00215194BD|nr:helix-turn-helix domain-containing protein [Flavobacterium sp. J372]MCR5862061.1 helix-turn-helix domain-containing protein [Flavobacterium sp. J372]
MNLYLKYNFDKICRAILEEQLNKFSFDYVIRDSGCVDFQGPVSENDYLKLHETLSRYGIEIIDNKKSVLVQKVKSLITNMIENCDSPLTKISVYLAEEMGENYRTLSQIFTEVCHLTIEQFIILHKIERVKQLLTTEEMSLTEISHLMNYSSVAHLSNQFKNSTGLSPSTFQRLAQKRRSFHLQT